MFRAARSSLLALALVALFTLLPLFAVAEPNNNDVSSFLGLHFRFFDPVQHALMEVYLKNATRIDYRVVFGSVAGAQCVRDQLLDVVRLDAGLVRFSWEEPTGTVQSNVLNLHTRRYHRAVAFAHWVIHNATLRVSGPMYAKANIAQLVQWRNATLAAKKFPIPVVDSLIPLSLDHLPINQDQIIVCPPMGSPLPPVLPVPPEPRHRQELSPHTPFGLLYNYTYMKPTNGSGGSKPGGDTPFTGSTQKFVLYLKNRTDVDFIVTFSAPTNLIHCQKDEPTYYTTVAHDMTRMSWQGMGLYGGTWENNVVSASRRWHHGSTFMPTRAAVFPPGPDFPHVYSMSNVWANISAMAYAKPNDEALVVCSSQLIPT